MKKLTFLLLILPILLSTARANPSFTVGSNYYLTIFAYPHDILKWPGSALFLTINPQTKPWQGDVTDIDNRPSESYIHNDQEVEFAPPYDYKGDPEDIRSWMNVAGYAYRMSSTLGGLYATGAGKILVEVNRTSLNMELLAEGIGRARESIGDETEYHMVPFRGETRAGRDDYGLKIIYAHHLFNNPFGLKLRYIEKTSEQPGGYIRFTREGQTVNVPHMTWGWATTGCNHIFGYSHINTDAFFQNDYSVFSGYQMDLQASYEHRGNYKTGIRYRRLREDGDSYKWRYDEGSNVAGRYYEDEYWKEGRSMDLLRGYSKVIMLRKGGLDAGVLFFLQRDGHTSAWLNKMAESDPAAEEKQTEYVIETNPFFNYGFKGGYLDFGLLLELARTGMRNTHTRWNSVSRSDQTDVLWSTSPYLGWTTSWEDFSRGSEWFFATGCEAYSSVGIYKRTALLLRLTLLRKYTSTEKIYGQSEIPEGEHSYEFRQTHARNDRRTETWMTGSFGLSYGLGPVQLLASLQLPLAYLIHQSTRLRDTETELFEHSKKNVWQVQEPTTVRMLLVYALSR